MENNLPIAQALSEIMKAVGAIAKKDKNTSQGFNFRGIDSVVNAVSPARLDGTELLWVMSK